MSDHPITPSPTRPVRPLLRAVALAWLLGADLLAQAEVFRAPDSGDDIIGEIRHARAHQEDTLIDIARRYSIGQDEMVMANPSVDRWLPKAGTDVVIPKEYILPDAPRAGIVVNIPEMRLYYFPVRASAPRKVPVAAKAPVVNTCKKPADKPANPEKAGAKTTAAKPGAKAATKSTAAANGKTANQSTVAAKAKPAARPASAANPKAAAKPCVASAAPRPSTRLTPASSRASPPALKPASRMMWWMWSRSAANGERPWRARRTISTRQSITGIGTSHSASTGLTG